MSELKNEGSIVAGMVPEELLTSQAKTPLHKQFNGASGATKFLEAVNDMTGASSLSPEALELLAAYAKLDKAKAIREAADKQAGKQKRDLIELPLEGGDKIWWIRTYTEEGPVIHVRGPKNLTPKAAEGMIALALTMGMGPDMKIDGSAKERTMLYEAVMRINAQNANNPNFQPLTITNYAPVGTTPPAQAPAAPGAESRFMVPPQPQAATPRKNTYGAKQTI